jgi:hypothetical protein
MSLRLWEEVQELLHAQASIALCIRSHRAFVIRSHRAFVIRSHRAFVIRSHRASVATVRQTVEIFLATPTAWQQVATFSVVSVATVRQTVEIFLATSTAWQRWLPSVLYP